MKFLNFLFLNLATAFNYQNSTKTNARYASSEVNLTNLSSLTAGINNDKIINTDSLLDPKKFSEGYYQVEMFFTNGNMVLTHIITRNLGEIPALKVILPFNGKKYKPSAKCENTEQIESLVKFALSNPSELYVVRLSHYEKKGVNGLPNGEIGVALEFVSSQEWNALKATETLLNKDGFIASNLDSQKPVTPEQSKP